MYLLDQRILGIAILLLLGMLVAVKRAATGSILDQPKSEFLVQLVNIFNLFFLLIVNPLSALLLIAGVLPVSDPTRFIISDPTMATMLEIVGLALYVLGVSSNGIGINLTEAQLSAWRKHASTQ